ncbi:MAG: cytidylate kinase family protein [Desulfobacter sp.]|nr:MAG: cytidylate kinase family protein [Desulfobacter sp.]
MSVITFFGRKFTGRAPLAEKAADILGYRVVYDRNLIDTAAREYGLKKKDIRKSIYLDPPMAERYSADKARCIAAVKSVLAEEVKKGQVIISGFLGGLVPSKMGLHILVTASENSRRRRLQRRNTDEITREGHQMLETDEAFLRWSLYLKTTEGRKPSNFDGVVSVSRTGQSELIDMIFDAASEKKEEMTPKEFSLAARVSRLMAEKGHRVSVDAKEDQVDLKIHKPVLMLSRYGKKLSALARSVRGVGNVRTRAGSLFYRADIYPGCEFKPAPQVSYRPIEIQYERMYAQVAGRRPAFVQKQDEQISSLAYVGRA